MRLPLICLLSLGTPFADCLQRVFPPICTLEFRYGVNVTLTDAQTGGPITGATLTLTEGQYTEVMQELHPPGNYAGAGERAGTYTLTVQAAGYQSQTLTNLVVDEDPCHVIPISRNVALTPD